MKLRPSIVSLIFCREFLDTTRDRKSLFLHIGIPFLMWPGMALIGVTGFFLYNAFQLSNSTDKESGIFTSKKAKATEVTGPYQVAVVGKLPERFHQLLDEDPKLNLIKGSETGISDVDLSQLLNYQKALTDEDASIDNQLGWNIFPQQLSDPVRSFKDKVSQILESGTAQLVVLHLPEEEDSREGETLFFTNWPSGGDVDLDTKVEPRDTVRAHLSTFRKELRKERYEEIASRAGIDLSRKEFMQQLFPTVKSDTVMMDAPSRLIDRLIAMVLPVMLTLVVVLGVYIPAIDSTAGEKEHRTLATLLCAPVSHGEIVCGKFLNVALFGAFAAAANVTSISMVQVIVIKAGNLDLPLNWYLPLIMVASLIPLALFYAAVSMCVSFFAKSFKEGQNLMTPAILTMCAPGYACAVPGLALTPATALVPGLNINLLMKAMLEGQATIPLAILCFVSMFVWTAVTLMLVTRMFSSERVRFDEAGGFFDVFTFRRDAISHSSPSLAVFIFLVTWVIAFYYQALTINISLELALFGSMLGIYAGIPLLITWYFQLPVKETLGLQVGRPTYYLATPLFVFFGLPVALWASTIIPVPPDFAEKMAEALGLAGDMNLLFALLMIAVLPAVCEEIAFRGMILRGLRQRFGEHTSVAISSVLFGLAHFPVYRFPPTMVLGFILGYLTLRSRSLYPAMILHFLWNGLAVVATYSASQAQKASEDQTDAGTPSLDPEARRAAEQVEAGVEMIVAEFNKIVEMGIPKALILIPIPIIFGLLLVVTFSLLKSSHQSVKAKDAS